MPNSADQIHKQKQAAEQVFSQGGRSHVSSSNPLTQYLTRWRIEQSIRRLSNRLAGRFSWDWNVLVICAGEGHEGSILCDMGFQKVMVTDLSENGVKAAVSRDSRLNGECANAESLPFPDFSYDLVIVQDGLHHLPRPALGFTEMLRVAKHAVILLEPHDSFAGNFIGTHWEENYGAINYVFRWRKKLVQDLASSYYCHNKFDNISQSFWHHNIGLERIGRFLGGGKLAIRVLSLIKLLMDAVFGRWGNQFCGLVIRHES